MKWKWILYIIVSLIIVWGLFSFGTWAIIKYWGEKVTATVTETPSRCGRYNVIKVLYENSEYKINIGRNDCKEGVYKLNQKVELLKHKNFDELIWPDSDFGIASILTLVALFFGIFTIRKKYRK